MPDRILIWGADAIGGTAGAFLKRAGNDVTFVDIEAEHVAAIGDPARGLAITGPIEALRITAPAFVPGALSGTWDHIYLCVKAQHTAAASQALLPHLSAGGYVLSLQNGLCEAIIADVVGRERTIGAFVNHGADWVGSGEILFGNHGLLKKPEYWDKVYIIGYRSTSYDAAGKLPARTQAFLGKLGTSVKLSDTTLWWVACGYDSIQLIKYAVEHGGTSPQAVRTAWESLKSFPGVFGDYTYTATDHNGYPTSEIVMNTANSFKDGAYSLAPGY
jgi:hypothetical protein